MVLMPDYFYAKTVLIYYGVPQAYISDEADDRVSDDKKDIEMITAVALIL